MNRNILLTSCCMTLLIAACVQDPNGAGQDNPEQLGSLSGTIVNTAPLPPIEKKSKEDLTQADFASTPTPASSSHILHETDEHIQTLAAIPTIRNSLEARQQNKAMGVPSQAELISSSSPVTVNRDKYGDIVANPVRLVSEFPVSTFSIDVDTGSYAVVRRHINGGVLPPSDAVRIEELVNYFNYHYKIPQDKEAPFSISTEIAPTPWNPNTHLLQVGLQGYESAQPRSAANLVFLLDVSGSMSSADKLPLLKNAFRLLVNKLNGDDRVTIVVYAGSSGVVLESTSGDSKGDILAALDKLEAGGSTHGSSGIQLAYSMAEQAFIKDGINRVILATDGDFNVGTVSHDALIDLIEQKKSQGIALTTLGFGSGNYNDYLMEQLADHGDGNYAYIDNLNEAKKVLVEQISSTLETIARDVKIQIEWNPKLVSEYRLIGYENRVLQREDFNNDKVDAGDIGAGHTVTALYEITLSNSSQPRIDPLRYEATKVVAEGHQSELAFVKLRYKKPDEMNSRLVELPLLKKQIKTDFNDSSDSLQFASAVAAYGDLLRGGKSVGDFTYSDVLQLARAGRGQDDHGYRAEFLKLVELTDLLDSRS